VSGGVKGSVIINQGQIGGQVAHQITNIGPQPRTLSPEAMGFITHQLQGLPIHEFEIEAVHGDAEARNLAFQIAEAVKGAGWVNTSFASSLFPQPVVGLGVAAPAETEEIARLLSCFKKAGLAPRVTINATLTNVHIVVGSRE